MAETKAAPLATGLRWSSILSIICPIVAIYVLSSKHTGTYHVVTWSIAQWMPPGLRTESINEAAWEFWEQLVVETHPRGIEEIPVVNVQDHLTDLLPYLETTFGKDWRRRPLLLKGLWSQEALLGNTSRRLSLNGFLQENLTIPYFTDARVKGALSPDSHAPVKNIVANMTRGAPHKIGTQLFVQTWPELIDEVAPVRIVTELFGSYFTPEAVKGTGPFQLLPALTTVPLFVASGKAVGSPNGVEDDVNKVFAKPYTALHCEPIGNVAVQLSGKKQWTLVRPEFSRVVKPSASPDGRAFFASWSSDYSHVPKYTAITDAGDAMWVPTWTWHRVDYIESEEIAIGASLFHFRAIDFVANNPLFAILIVPSIILELFGYQTQ